MSVFDTFVKDLFAAEDARKRHVQVVKDIRAGVDKRTEQFKREIAALEAVYNEKKGLLTKLEDSVNATNYLETLDKCTALADETARFGPLQTKIQELRDRLERFGNFSEFLLTRMPTPFVSESKAAIKQIMPTMDYVWNNIKVGDKFWHLTEEKDVYLAAMRTVHDVKRVDDRTTIVFLIGKDIDSVTVDKYDSDDCDAVKLVAWPVNSNFGDDATQERILACILPKQVSFAYFEAT